MNKQRGFSILEIFIGLALGAVLTAGVLSVFVGMRTTTEETSSIGELQENARFALNVLTDDLLRQGFWGDLPGALSTNALQSFPASPSGLECSGGGTNNGTFPTTGTGQFRELWGATVVGGSTMSCSTVNNAKTESDLLQLKRAITFPQPQNSDGTLVNPLDPDRYYLYENGSDAAIFRGNAATPPDVENGRYWQYQHHIYYVREDRQGTNTVPVLVQGRLTSEMVFGPLVEGIERIRFMYGVDTDGDGAVNAFISATNMTEQMWNNSGNSRILAVKVYVLARSIFPDADYENTQSYQMGDLNVNFLDDSGAGDNYRRLLMSSTVTLFNGRVDTWQ